MASDPPPYNQTYRSWTMILGFFSFLVMLFLFTVLFFVERDPQIILERIAKSADVLSTQIVGILSAYTALLLSFFVASAAGQSATPGKTSDQIQRALALFGHALAAVAIFTTGIAFLNSLQKPEWLLMVAALPLCALVVFLALRLADFTIPSIKERIRRLKTTVREGRSLEKKLVVDGKWCWIWAVVLTATVPAIILFWTPGYGLEEKALLSLVGLGGFLFLGTLMIPIRMFGLIADDRNITIFQNVLFVLAFLVAALLIVLEDLEGSTQSGLSAQLAFLAGFTLQIASACWPHGLGPVWVRRFTIAAGARFLAYRIVHKGTEEAAEKLRLLREHRRAKK